ncbi:MULTISPECIES: electron transfer flavoprotein subunit alpha/FixB family protein [Azospirillum]|uniref:Electron transfer flavoprotein subunit alpha/FixB family protein n=2 Tax=Azospirillum TaxID=191 RepID=A0A6L3AVX0_AZOBR|nr:MULTISPECIES: electron transfer flavoprotein subunit alpha/FixB family protein [Azospirillum]KAA0681630.1 electron transfer flavoprotein subunit alpha/FixB family protein [Azospirillum brasilense]MBK3803616.1 electron transfer flavoprotein subunit alpha [Azospirillum argentinense]NUB04804.1 electron transfer flavoprotein subunit alpha/FixB family protein [Azospirillum baldaniorum]QCN96196.1 electron transfer flavoprotein subunit alpha/FixB family protein [Azospirillum argentinense]QCO00895.
MSEPSKPQGRKFQLPEHLKEYKGIWVIVEQERGSVHSVSWELVGEARKLADKLGVEVGAVVLGADSPELNAICGDAFTYGADVVYKVTDPVLADYRTDPYTRVMTDVVNTYKPEIVLLGATTLGRDLAGAIATTLATGLTADCTELDIYMDNRSLAATRPTFGGTLLCTIQTLAYRPQMATVRPRVMSMPDRDDSRTGRVVEVFPNLRETDVITKVLSFIADREQNEAQLAFADIIVAAGKGLGKPENLKLVFDLAKVLGGEVGVTRPLVQAGWTGFDRQVGQTGKTVRPKLYIAAGISGAIQHRVGMEKSDLILAINTDPNAPIFDFAHLGLVGDALTILPALTDAFGKRLSVNRLAG